MVRRNSKNRACKLYAMNKKTGACDFCGQYALDHTMKERDRVSILKGGD